MQDGFVHGRGRSEGLRGALESFVEASLNDFVLHSYKRGRSHNHGRGLAYVQGLLGDLSFMYFKTSLPIPCAKEALVIPELRLAPSSCTAG